MTTATIITFPTERMATRVGRGMSHPYCEAIERLKQRQAEPCPLCDGHDSQA